MRSVLIQLADDDDDDARPRKRINGGLLEKEEEVGGEDSRNSSGPTRVTNGLAVYSPTYLAGIKKPSFSSTLLRTLLFPRPLFPFYLSWSVVWITISDRIVFRIERTTSLLPSLFVPWLQTFFSSSFPVRIVRSILFSRRVADSIRFYFYRNFYRALPTFNRRDGV